MYLGTNSIKMLQHCSYMHVRESTRILSVHEGANKLYGLDTQPNAAQLLADFYHLNISIPFQSNSIRIL